MAKILVVDDKREISKVLDRILTAREHDIDLCHDGVEAKEMYDAHDYDLVVTDILMPEKDGLEFAKHIRKSEENTDKHTSILAITGGGTVVTSEMAHEGAKLYADQILLKPFNSESFIAAVDSLIKA
jgi:DNA-binding response OmpR family regulator